jgi:hypothetical protein
MRPIPPAAAGDNDMGPDLEACRRCLARVQALLPCQYAQYVIENPDDHEYSVIASVVPVGGEGYATAHRTGIIGQVFRLEQAILAPDVAKHPLYDPFDSSIQWELCVPLFRAGRMIAAINLEGAAALEVCQEEWDRISNVVRDTTGCIVPPAPPAAECNGLVHTRRIVIRPGDSNCDRAAVVILARTLARGGASTLLVGPFADLLRNRAPNMEQAQMQGLGVSYCYVGVERRLDLLDTGALTPDSAVDVMNWWRTSNGRYEFVVADLLGVEQPASSRPHPPS